MAIRLFFIAIIAALAQWERENLGERVRFGMEQMVREGRWHGSQPPYGFNLENGYLIINDDEAAIVRLIFEKYLEGDGPEKLAKWLNSQGIKTKSNKNWSHRSAMYVIKNPAYIGNMRWNTKTKTEDYFEVKGVIPPIISREIFERAQDITDSRKLLHPREKASSFYFAGHLRCGRCGYKLTGRTTINKQGRYKYYWCNGRARGLCDFPLTPEKRITEEFLNHIRYLRESFAASEVAATIEPNQIDERTQNEIERLERELKKIEENSEKWQRAYVADAISLEDLKKRRAEDKAREAEIQTELRKLRPDLENTEEPLRPDEMAELLLDFEENWQKASDNEKKQIVALLVDEITVTSTRNIIESTRKRSQLTMDIIFR